MVSGVLVEVPFLLSSLSLSFSLWTLEFEQKFKSGEVQSYSYISGFLNAGPYIFLIIPIFSVPVLCFNNVYVIMFSKMQNGISISTDLFNNFLFEFQASSGLFQEKGIKGSSLIGHFLGWGMAAIYIGGRIPQIFLNVSFPIEVAYMASPAEVYGNLYEQIAKKEKSLNCEEIEVRFEPSPTKYLAPPSSHHKKFFCFFMYF